MAAFTDPLTKEDLNLILENFEMISTRLNAIDLRLGTIEQGIHRIDQNVQIIAKQGGYEYDSKQKIVLPRKRKVG